MLPKWFKIIWNHYAKDGYTISDTQSFSQDLSTLLPLEEIEKYVSYNLPTLCNNIPVKETIG